ncbi:hypothetical protein PGTUg99_005966 [Puccinia graminis f. sp. tritici]|uniref:FH2 domain-containing protein n=1 Tax=Puccinia graminis f. sp. tritici TaxID=56615 RepID=A0A5B0SLA9_PUCGR|nr:hypothetical protein PGTUg99_005966 [Puccinia graminis f. sp. tritici]
MPKFVREAGNKLAILKDEITLAQNSYTQILMYFGEETDERKQMNSMAFFGIFKTFVTSYKKARDENRKWNEARNARQKRLEVNILLPLLIFYSMMIIEELTNMGLNKK